MRQNLSTKYDPALVQPLPFWEAIWQLPLQYIKVLIKPSANTLSKEIGKASWGIVLAQFLGLVIITVALGWIAHMIPSAALHAITALHIGSAQPLAFLPSPLNGITFVLASFFIGLGTAYLFSKGSGGQGTFLAHFYCLLVCTVPLVTVSGLLLLIPATGWLVVVPGGIVCALFIYRMVLHTFTIMAVHGLGASRATLIVLILPMLIFVVFMLMALLFLTEGEILADGFEVFFWGGGTRKKEDREAQ